MEVIKPKVKRIQFRKSTSLMPAVLQETIEVEKPSPRSVSREKIARITKTLMPQVRTTRGKPLIHKPWLYRKKNLEERMLVVQQKKVLKSASFTNPGPASSKAHLRLDTEPVSKQQYQKIVENQPVVLTEKIDSELEKYPTALKQLKENGKPVFISVEEEMARLNAEDENTDDEMDENPNSIVCRVCGVAGPNRFSLIGSKAQGLQLRKTLTKYLNIKIVEDENLPLYICQLCYQTVATFDEFQKRSIVATNRLKAIVTENSEIIKLPWYGDNVIAKATASPEYLKEVKKASETPKPKRKQFIATTNIEKLFGLKTPNQKIVINRNESKSTKRASDSDDDVQILTPPPAKKLIKTVSTAGTTLTPLTNPEALSASLGSGKAILIPISTPPGTPGGGNRYLIATPQTSAVKPTTSNIISTAANAAGITPVKLGKKYELPKSTQKTPIPVKKMERRIITSKTGHVDLVDLQAITQGKPTVITTPPTSVVKPTIQLTGSTPNLQGKLQLKNIISPTPITKVDPPEPAIEPWSSLPFRAPAKDDKYTYVVRMDRKPGDQPYFILTANPTKLSAGPELTRQNVGIICKDVYRAEVAKNKARSSNGNFSNIGLHSWAQHIIWLRTLSNFDKDIKPYLKESADKVLEYGNRKPKVAPKIVQNNITTIVPKGQDQKLFLIPITTMGADGKPVQTFQVANVVPQPSTSSTPNIKNTAKLVSSNSPQSVKTTPVTLSSPITLSSPVKNESPEAVVPRTEIIYQKENDDIFDMECVSENDEDDEDEPMEEERLEDDDEDEELTENTVPTDEVITESEIVPDNEIFTETEIVTESEVTTETVVGTKSEIQINSENEVISEHEEILETEVVTETVATES